MRRRLRSNNSTIIKLAMLGVVAMAGGFLLTSFLGSKSETQALSATEFQAGRIIDDSIFYNPNTMTAAEIDAFIDSHNPACDMWGTQKVYGDVTRAEYVKQLRAGGNTKFHDPPFVCISEYYENPETHKTNFSTGGKKEEGMLSAGEIIYQAAHEYNVNPQVLLVMLKKESYVWGDDWPHSFQYNTVMGYACPDGAPCDSKYFGFYNQVMMAAWQLNYYREHIYSYNYRPYATNNILYNPDRSCGSKSVYLENIATTSLYIYTPYVPNDGALANYPGTSYCGSYGNRNFYMYFREWFGSTLGIKKEEAYFPDGEYYIVSASDTSKSIQLKTKDNNPGTGIILGDRSENDFSKFYLSRTEDGSYLITNRGSNLVIDITGANIQSGTSIEQWTNNGSVAQRFMILDNKNGSFTIAAARNKALSLTPDSENIINLDWTDTDPGQEFRIIPATRFIDDGEYYVISDLSENLALTIAGTIKSESNVELRAIDYSNNQKLSFVYDAASGYYVISPASNPNLAVDIQWASKEKNANIQLWSKNKSCAQKWLLLQNDDGSLRFSSSCSNLSMDVHNGIAAEGANVASWSYNTTAAQKWHLYRAYSSPNDISDGYYEFAKPESNLLLSSEGGILELSSNSSGTTTQTFRLHYLPELKYYTISDSNNNSICGNSIERNLDSLTCYWIITKTSNDLFSIRSLDSKRLLLDNEFWAVNTADLPLKIFSGTYTIRSAMNRNYVLDISGASSENGANVQTWLSNNTLAQRFTLSYIEGSNTYTIGDLYTNRLLEASDSPTRVGTNVTMSRRTNSCNQQWQILQVEDDRYKILDSCNLLPIDAYGGVVYSGTNALVWHNYDNKLNQQWVIEETH